MVLRGLLWAMEPAFILSHVLGLFGKLFHTHEALYCNGHPEYNLCD